jgi:hypothetical protein
VGLDMALRGNKGMPTEGIYQRMEHVSVNGTCGPLTNTLVSSRRLVSRYSLEYRVWIYADMNQSNLAAVKVRYDLHYRQRQHAA